MVWGIEPQEKKKAECEEKFSSSFSAYINDLEEASKILNVKQVCKNEYYI